MSRRLSLAHARFGLWLIRTGRKITERGFAIVEFEIAKWHGVDILMTESEEDEADAGFSEVETPGANPRYSQSSQPRNTHVNAA